LIWVTLNLMLTQRQEPMLIYDKQTVESGMVSLGLEFNDIINFLIVRLNHLV